MEREPNPWDLEAATYDEAADHGLADPGTRAAWQRLLLPRLPVDPVTVADLGCGTGTLSVLLAEAGHRVLGLDSAARMLQLARAKTAGVLPRPGLVRSEVGSPPLHAGSVDVVLCRHVLWAMPDPAATLERWRRLLAPGGLLLLVEGRWGTGAGIGAAEGVALVSDLGGSHELVHLTDPVLWGRPVTDERYLLASRPPPALGQHDPRVGHTSRSRSVPAAAAGARPSRTGCPRDR